MNWTKITTAILLISLKNGILGGILPDTDSTAPQKIQHYISQNDAQKSKSMATPRFMGGKEAEWREYPYTVGIVRNGTLIAGGAIIAEDYILTFRSMVADVDASELTVIHENIEKNVSEILIGDLKYEGLAALLKLETKFDLNSTNITSIELVKSSVQPGRNCVVSGVGAKDLQSPPEDKLHYTDLKITFLNECYYAWNMTSASELEGRLCASVTEDATDVCWPTFGDPLVCDDGLLAGISEIRSLCMNVSIPALYLDVAYYGAWILQQMEEVTTQGSDTTTPGAANYICVNQTLVMLSIFVFFITKHM